MGGDCPSVSDHFQRAEFQFFLVLSSYSWLLLYLVLLPSVLYRCFWEHSSINHPHASLQWHSAFETPSMTQKLHGIWEKGRVIEILIFERAMSHHFILLRWRNLRIHVLTCMGKLRFEENLIVVDTIWTLCGSLAGRGTKYPVRIAKASIFKLYSAKYKCFPVTSYISVTWI